MSKENKDKNQEQGEPDKPVKKSKSRLLFLSVLGVVFLLVVIAGVGFSGVIFSAYGTKEGAEDKKNDDVVEKTVKDEKSSKKVVDNKPPIYISIKDPFVVNIKSSKNGKKKFAKVSLGVECVGDFDDSYIEKVSPKMRDIVTSYLRNFREEDMHGNSGVIRMKKELLKRFRTIPGLEESLNDVLIIDFVIS